MNRDLMLRVNDVDNCLTYSENFGTTSYRAFTEFDEQILGQYLFTEANEKPHVEQNSNWKMLVGSPTKFQNPRKYLAEHETNSKAIMGFFEDVRSGENRIVSLNEEERELVDRLLNEMPKVPDWVIKFDELVVHQAKNLSSRCPYSPLQLTGMTQGCDWIIKNIFPEREQFELYSNALNDFAIAGCLMTYSMMGQLEVHAQKARKTPLVGWFIGRKWDKIASQLPPKRVAENFVKAELEYDKMRADRIYGKTSILELMD